MQGLPELLQPRALTRLQLPSGKFADLPICAPKFTKWTGQPPKFTFGNKPVLLHQGAPIFAELLVLRLLEAEGWAGVWVSSYGGLKFLREMPEGPALTSDLIEIPDAKREFIEALTRSIGRVGGCFDVFAWRDDELIFCETKRRGHDQLRQPQLGWIEAALVAGISSDRLLVVEWSFAGSS